jgi:hypothetical protein
LSLGWIQPVLLLVIIVIIIIVIIIVIIEQMVLQIIYRDILFLIPIGLFLCTHNNGGHNNNWMVWMVIRIDEKLTEAIKGKDWCIIYTHRDDDDYWEEVGRGGVCSYEIIKYS